MITAPTLSVFTTFSNNKSTDSTHTKIKTRSCQLLKAYQSTVAANNYTTALLMKRDDDIVALVNLIFHSPYHVPRHLCICNGFLSTYTVSATFYCKHIAHQSFRKPSNITQEYFPFSLFTRLLSRFDGVHCLHVCGSFKPTLRSTATIQSFGSLISIWFFIKAQTSFVPTLARGLHYKPWLPVRGHFFIWMMCLSFPCLLTYPFWHF